MQNFSAANIAALNVLVEAGAEVATVAYNPLAGIAPNPETVATGDGWVQYYRETTQPYLVEVIYTR